MEHESAQTVTVDSQTEGLTPLEVRVLGYLLRGSTLTHAGEQAGVRRETVSRWLHRPGVFRTAYSAECQRLLAGMRESLDAIHRKATDAAETSFDDGYERTGSIIGNTLALLADEMATVAACRLGVSLTPEIPQEHAQTPEAANAGGEEVTACDW